MKLNLLLKDFFNKFSKNRNVKYGLPFISLIILGSFGLKEFTQLRYIYSSKTLLTPDEAERLGIPMKKERVTLEEEYEKITKLDINNWENKRGPRPWEEDTLKSNPHYQAAKQ